MQKTTSIVLQKEDLQRVKRAAKRAGVSQSVLMRDAVLSRANEILERCPTCGRAHKAA